MNVWRKFNETALIFNSLSEVQVTLEIPGSIPWSCPSLVCHSSTARKAGMRIMSCFGDHDWSCPIRFKILQITCFTFMWGAVAQWSEHLQLKLETLSSIPGGCPGCFLFQLARGGPSRARLDQLCCSKTLYTVEHLWSMQTDDLVFIERAVIFLET